MTANLLVLLSGKATHKNLNPHDVVKDKNRQQRQKAARAVQAAAKAERMRHPSGKSAYAARVEKREHEAAARAKEATRQNKPRPKKHREPDFFGFRNATEAPSPYFPERSPAMSGPSVSRSSFGYFW